MNSIESYDDGSDACEKGTASGGSIEVYMNKSDAKKRNKYLSNFDEGILASFHEMEGTVIIHLNDKLTATEQKELFNKIITKIENGKK